MYLKKLKIKKKHKRKKKKIGKLTQFIQEKNYNSGINEREKNKQKIPKLHQKLLQTKFSSALKKFLHFSHIITTIYRTYFLYISPKGTVGD